MIQQQQSSAPAHAPQAPATPSGPLSPQDQAELASGLREAFAASAQVQQQVQQAARQAAQAARDQARASGGGRMVAQNGSGTVITDGSGRIVVTGADGRTIAIDPHSGLDGDQIQELVQNTLQPPQQQSAPFPKELIPIVAIVFPCLAAMIYFITRMFTRRGPTGNVVAALPAEAAARLARIEQAVDAVAIEVERISEAQRYSAQLLTDRIGGDRIGGDRLGGERGEMATARAVPVAGLPMGGGVDRG